MVVDTGGQFTCGGKVSATLQTYTNRGRAVWVLDSPVHYCNSRGVDVLVPPGFTTDFASVPRLFWRVIPPVGPHGAAAVVHDYLYVHQDNWSRRDADVLFSECLAVLGVEPWRRRLMWCGVRLGGWIGWARFKKNSQ